MNSGDGLRYFLSVSSHVLHRRAANGAWNSAEAFYAATILVDGESHKVVPVFTSAGVKQHFLEVAFKFHTCQRYFQYQAGPAAIGDQKVAAAAQYQKGKLAGKGKRHRFGNFMFRMGVNKIPRRATHLKSGQRCKGDVFLGAQKIGNRVQERRNYGNEFLIGRMGADQSGGKRCIQREWWRPCARS